MEKSTFRALCLSLLLASTTSFSQGLTNFTGQVLYHNNYPIPGVTASLRPVGGSVIATAVTNSDGIYEFTNVTPGNYKITFSIQQASAGVDLNDAYLVMMKINNQIVLNPIQTLAADVNNSGTITYQDYSMIYVGYLNRGIPFPNPWVFESLTTLIPPSSRDGVISRGGSSSGDVNGSLQPDDKKNTIFVTYPLIDCEFDLNHPVDLKVVSGETVRIMGMHLVLDIPDEIMVTGVESVTPSVNVFESGNQINITWLDETLQGIELEEGEPLVTLKTQPARPSREGDQLMLKLGGESHFIDMQGNLVEGIKLNLPVVNFTNGSSMTHCAYPNPFSEKTTIEFQAREDGHVLLTLYDQSGRAIKELVNSVVPAGSHKVKVEGDDLLPGIYHYTLVYVGTDDYFNSGTIIKSK